MLRLGCQIVATRVHLKSRDGSEIRTIKTLLRDIELRLLTGVSRHGTFHFYYWRRGVITGQGFGVRRVGRVIAGARLYGSVA
jgi:hypothetical protein